MTQPTKQQIKRFLDCFETLGQFEASSRLLRGYGGLNKEEWPEQPDPSVMAVKIWLESLSH